MCWSSGQAGRRAEAPVLLIEVLSPTVTGIDLTEKPAEYTSFNSLEVYIVASQDEPICWVWQRSGSKAGDSAPPRAFPPRPAELAGRDQALEIPALGISLPLAEIYRRIGG